MELANDPNDRRRVDAETQRRRDAEVARLRRSGATFRAIAERLGMSLGGVQKALRRAQKLAEAVAGEEPGDVVAVLDDDLRAADVTCVADIAKLSPRALPAAAYARPVRRRRAGAALDRARGGVPAGASRAGAVENRERRRDCRRAVRRRVGTGKSPSTSLTAGRGARASTGRWSTTAAPATTIGDLAACRTPAMMNGWRTTTPPAVTG